MAIEKRQTQYACKCADCGAASSVGQWIMYDVEGERGKKAFCLDCGFNRKQAELAIRKPKPAVEPVSGNGNGLGNTAVPTAPAAVATPAAVGGDLAAIIAAAVAPMVQGRLDEARVVELIEERLKPPAHTITVQHVDGTTVDMGRQHKQFEELLVMCSARQATGSRLNIQITGTGGSGKSVAAKNVAKALNLDFALVPTLVESYKFFGHLSPGTDKYVPTAARRVWQYGGILCLDDFDGTDPTVGVELLAIRNGGMSFPDGYIERHPDCIVIMTCNTWGYGATNDYVGRLKQDAAWLDGFVGLEWEIDEDLERDTCGNPAWARRVQEVRANVRAKGIKVLVTPRASYFGVALLSAGLSWERTERATLRKGMTEDQWRSVC